MDSSDPDALRAYLSGRMPQDLVDKVLRHLEDADTYSEPPPDAAATLRDFLPQPSKDTIPAEGPLDNRRQIARLPTLSKAAEDGEHLVRPVSMTFPGEENTLLKPGTRIRHFQVSRLLGRGGMGEVYLARDTQLGRKVALKVIKPEYVSDKTTLVRFLQEARVTARFNHPHIVTIYAVGEFEGMPFVALEYLEGQDLSERLKDEQPSLQECLRICLAVAEAIAEAHKHGILHRDLKPANILIPRDGRVRVVDFGLAQEIEGFRPEREAGWSDETAEPDQGPRIVGTPAYMAPEQWRGKDFSAATDMWALGVIMHEVICGKRPYADSDPITVGVKVCSSDLVPLHDAIAGLPPRIAQLIESCLSKDHEERPSATMFAEVLHEVLTDTRQPSAIEESPFRGLLPFAERHADVFFGREEELNTCMERLRYETSLVVVGPSGAGKTSFVQAGLIPRLKEGNEWTVIRIRPGESPLERLAARMISADAEETGSSSIRASFDDRIFTGSVEITDVDARQTEIERLAQVFRDSPNKLCLGLNGLATQRQTRVLLLIDQLEELFTLCRDPEEQALFIEAIASAADDANEPVRVLCTVRDDFLGHVARSGEAARSLLEHVMILEPPGPSALKDVITLPLLRVGYSFDDPTLPDEMVAAVDDATSLPLLQFAARSLWDVRDQVTHQLKRADYEAMGGVEGALARHADGVLHGLGHDELKTARALLLRLVTPESTRKVRSEKQLLDGLPPEATTVYQRLTKSRLLSVKRGSSSSEDGTRLELAHESLIHNWKRLSRWIEESKEELILLNEVSQAAELWQRRGRQDEELWSGSGLEEALKILGRGETEIPSLISDFLETGRLRDEANRHRRRFWSFAIPLFLVVIMAVLFLQKMDAEDSQAQSERGRLQALHQRKTAENQRKTAQQKQVEALMESAQTAYTEGDTLEARAKIRNALEIAHTDASPFLGLWWQLQRKPERWSQSVGTHYYHLIFSQDGRYAAAAAMNGSVELLDSVTGARQVLRGHNDQVVRVAFSPDGKLLASTGFGENVRVWDTESGEERYALPRPSGSGRSIAFSRDGKQLAVANQENRVRRWTLGEQPSPEDFVFTDQSRIYDVSFDDENKLLVARGKQSKLLLTGPEPNDSVRTLATGLNTSGGERARFSPGGRRIAWVAGKKVATIWDVRTGKTLNRFSNGQLTDNHLFKLNVSGSHFTMPANDGMTHVYDVDSGDLVTRVRPAHVEFNELALSPDASKLLESGPGYLRISHTDQPDFARKPTGDLDPVYALAMSPDGRQIASAGTGFKISLWNSQGEAKVQPFPGMNGGKQDSIAYSGDGRYLAWTDNEGWVRVWNRRKGVLHKKFTAGPVNPQGGRPKLRPQGLRISHGGRFLVYLDQSWLAAWNVETGRQLYLRRWKSDLEGALAMSKDGQRGLISLSVPGTSGGTISLWDLAQGRKIRRIGQQEQPAPGVGYDPRNRYLVTGGWDGVAKLWDINGRKRKTLFKGGARINHIATHPDGQRVAFAMTNGTARVLWLDTGKTLDLKGHVNEVNHVSFSADGRLLASGGDDGTVRLWDAKTGLKLWSTHGLLANPARHLTHAGWDNLDPKHKDDAGPTGTQWAQRLSSNARFSSNSAELPWLCISTHDDQVEFWNTKEDHLTWNARLGHVQDIAAVKTGCIARTPTSVIRYSESGAAVPFPIHKDTKPGKKPPVTALSVVRDAILVAVGPDVQRYGLDGTLLATYRLSPGISALSLTKESPTGTELLVVGFEDGNVETLALDSLEYGFNTQVVIQRSSRVTRIIPVEGSLIAIGMANGWTGLWDASSRRLLDQVELHGSANHLLSEGGRLHIATDLGQSFSWDVATFNLDYCALLRQVWEDVPVRWLYGQAVAFKAPEQHRCKPDALPEDKPSSSPPG